jgi:hypothetical protein
MGFCALEPVVLVSEGGVDLRSRGFSLNVSLTLGGLSSFSELSLSFLVTHPLSGLFLF